ncbi:protein DPCD [Microplitis mediator]|uniref:protein DPCD n=1 Tax=Microplitis mediator TaxID=375433 RepID=UPI0025529111|nr:protein DPCD [Microplitis mediator]
MSDYLDVIKSAKKTSIIQDGKRKVHFLLSDGREFVEEYNLNDNVLSRRAWRTKNKLGRDEGWSVEIGDPELKKRNSFDIGIQENQNNPFVTRKMTKLCLEWRIRNLPYSKDTYTVHVNDKKNKIIVKTSNKKYYKEIDVPDLERINLKLEQDRVSFDHKFNTLIINYQKPPALLEMEKKIMNEVLALRTVKEGDVQCPTS